MSFELNNVFCIIKYTFQSSEIFYKYRKCFILLPMNSVIVVMLTVGVDCCISVNIGGMRRQ